MNHRPAAQIRSVYDTVAGSYAEVLSDTSFEADIDLATIRDFVEQLGEDGALSVLDAGCGTGRMIGYLRSLNAAIVPMGVDISPGMLDQARASHPDVGLVEADLVALPFSDERFHGVLAWYSIIHTAPHNLVALFTEFGRVLRPGGVLLLGYQSGVGERTSNRAYGHAVDFHAFLHHTPYVEASLRMAGFSVDTHLDRGLRNTERHDQSFVLARRSPTAR